MTRQSGSAICPKEPQYAWPHQSFELQAAVSRQLARSLSDQTAGGIIGEFEHAFGKLLGAEHCLAFSSGTAAIHSMVTAAGLIPGDEILVGAYGFFASASPFVYEGILVRFVDVDGLGNIDLTATKAAISSRTRGVMCVHMWGNPCDMEAFRKLCDANGLWLFEDCSHAHFAKSRGRRVGLLSDLAAFSFNQKALTCGEGGILVCRTKALRDRAMLFGHYNKRCFAEILPPSEGPDLRLTGYGLKYRPHTLAMAVGVEQIRIAAEIEKRRRRNVEILQNAIIGHPFLDVLQSDRDGDLLGLYVLPLALRCASDKECSDRRSAICAFLQARGARLMDVPDSTRIMSDLPLFRSSGPEQPSHDPVDESTLQPFPMAVAFQRRIMKLPLWGYEGDEIAVNFYAQALADTADIPV